MQIILKPGRYVVAVSGGVDSMVLLHLLFAQYHAVESAKWKVQSSLTSHFPLDTSHSFVVAHINEGLRPDSALDQKLVKETARKYGLPFYTTDAKLTNPSEALGRKVRYEFLNKIADRVKADAIITAHHQDDMLETAIINLMRGTKRRGLSSLKSRPKLIRPLLKYSKKEIYDYAKKEGIKWREDTMNKDEKFLRNYIRNNIVPALTKERRIALLENIENTAKLNQKIDELLGKIAPAEASAKAIGRLWFINLPHAVAKEYLALWFARRSIVFDETTLERLVTSIKTLKPGKKVDINRHRSFRLTRDHIELDS